MRNHALNLFLCLSLLLTITSCKTEPVDDDPTPQGPTIADKLVGTYEGQCTELYQFNPAPYPDTTVYDSNLVIISVSSDGSTLESNYGTMDRISGNDPWDGPVSYRHIKQYPNPEWWEGQTTITFTDSARNVVLDDYTDFSSVSEPERWDTQCDYSRQ